MVWCLGRLDQSANRSGEKMINAGKRFARAALVCALPLGFAVPALAGQSGGEWVDVENIPGCSVWVPGQFPGKPTWTGSCLEGKAHGSGRLTYEAGYIEGEYMNGMMQGQGVMDGSLFGNDGDSIVDGRYEGTFKDGQFDGQGLLKGQMSRQGETMPFAYDGSFSHGVFHGKGDYTMGDADKGIHYLGEFENGEFGGHGAMYIGKTARYEGQFLQGKFHGEGTFVYSYGQTYTGAFANNYEHGRGVMTFSDGTRYEGEFKEGGMQGRGIATLKDGSTCEGEWKAGVLQGFGKGTVSGRVVPCLMDERGIHFAESSAKQR